MTVGERIKLKREQIGLSQTELAERANYSDKSAISKLEHSGNNISMKQVERLAQALGCSSQYLMGWEEEKQSKKDFAQDLFKDDIGEIIDRDKAIEKAREYYFLNRSDNFENDPDFWNNVEQYLKYRFMVHLWNINFDETIITKKGYFQGWKEYTIDKLCKPSILLDDYEVCNAVRKKYGLPKASYDDFFVEQVLQIKTDEEKNVLIELSKNLNAQGMERLIDYTKDLLKIYQYCKDDQIYESE